MAEKNSKTSASIFDLLSKGKKMISGLNDRYDKQFRRYTFKVTSKNGIAEIKTDNMKLTDSYIFKIINVKQYKEKIDISTNAVSIKQCVKGEIKHPDFSTIYSSDSFMDLQNDLTYDVRMPLPNPIVFKSNSDFEICIQLCDK